MRAAFATFVLLHGLAHLVGFLTPWGVSPKPASGQPPAPSPNLLFAGRLELSDAASRGLSFLWLALALAFAAVAVGMFRQTTWAASGLIAVSSLSLFATLAWWPTARIGAVINALLLVGILVWMFLQRRADAGFVDLS